METIQLSPPAIRDAIAKSRAAIEHLNPQVHLNLAIGAEAADVMGALTDDVELANAVLVRPVIGQDGVQTEALTELVGRTATDTAAALARLGELGLPRDWQPSRGLDARQAETLRKMLLAVVSDPRLVLARLAEQLVSLRHAREASPEERERRAVEARAIFAPLANRLGVWQLKWELEDLAFRYLEPDEYKKIAAELNERRADRERYIETLCTLLRAELEKAGIQAEVYGRPKHIYSIYRKMMRKP